MRQIMILAAFVSTLALSTAVVAKQRTIKLAIGNMTCASCPYIVKKSIAQVPGVSRVTISYAQKTATVTFDDTETSVDEIAGSSAKNGFPAKRLKGDDR